MMSIDKLKAAADRVLARRQAVLGRGEEATKQALVLPFIETLGYDIWHPDEVCPEFDADFAVKRAGQKEKVDLAIIIGGQPRIYIEVKASDVVLDGHEGQLARYFNSTASVSLGILTNGIEYRFYSDAAQPNIMDPVPFHFSRLDAPDPGFDVVARFHKSVFSPTAIRDYATELNCTSKLVDLLKQELDLREREPSERLVRWLLSVQPLHEGAVTAKVVERFKPITKNAIQRVMRDIVRRSVAAMENELAAPPRHEAADPAATPPAPSAQQAAVPTTTALEASKEPHPTRITTTEAELACYAVAKALFDASALRSEPFYDSAQRTDVPIELTYKDTSVYFAICFNKPSFWAMRIVIEGRKPYVAFNVDEAVGTPLIPPGVQRLEPNAFGEFRLPVSSADELRRLDRLVLASFAHTLAENRAARKG